MYFNEEQIEKVNFIGFAIHVIAAHYWLKVLDECFKLSQAHC